MRQKLKEIRELRKLTQQQVADLIGKSRPVYALYELGKINLSLEVAQKIKKALKYSKDDLFIITEKEG